MPIYDWWIGCCSGPIRNIWPLSVTFTFDVVMGLVHNTSSYSSWQTPTACPGHTFIAVGSIIVASCQCLKIMQHYGIFWTRYRHATRNRLWHSKNALKKKRNGHWTFVFLYILPHALTRHNQAVISFSLTTRFLVTTTSTGARKPSLKVADNLPTWISGGRQETVHVNHHR